MKDLLNETKNIDINDLHKFFYAVYHSDCFGLDTISSILGFGWEASLKFLAQLEFVGAVEQYGENEVEFVEVFENYTNRVLVVKSSELSGNSKNWSIVDGPVSRFEYRFKPCFANQIQGDHH